MTGRSFPHRLELTADLRPQFEADYARALACRQESFSRRLEQLRTRARVDTWARPAGVALSVLGLWLCGRLLSAQGLTAANASLTAALVALLALFLALPQIRRAVRGWSRKVLEHRHRRQAVEFAGRALRGAPITLDYSLENGLLESRSSAQQELLRFDLRTAREALLAGKLVCFFEDSEALTPIRTVYCPDQSTLARLREAVEGCSIRFETAP